jgi:N-methylhydantoinase A
MHQRLYGVRFHVPVELVALRVIATGATPNVEEALPEQGQTDLAKALMEIRPSYFAGAWVDTPNYDRAKLAVGTKITGPAIIRQYDTTTVLLPRHTAEVDGHGNLLIRPVLKGN